jgi:predicted GNAT family acetyltransferase
MDIQHKEDQQSGQFFIEQEGKRVALLVYDKADDNRLVIEHTEVDKSLRGQKIGYELVHSTIQYARNNGLKVLPICPFARKIMERNADWSDVAA